MNRDDVMGMFELVQSNYKKLNTCSIHDFSIDLTPSSNIRKQYKCTNCGGCVDNLRKKWYEEGLKHARQGGVSSDTPRSSSM